MRAPRLRWALVVVGLASLAATWTGCAAAGLTKCQFNSDCSVGYCGPDGTCQRNCVVASRDCPRGFICDQNAQCVPGQGGGNAGGGDVGGAGPSVGGSGGAGAGASVSSSGAGAGSSTSASSGTGGAGSKHELDRCASDGECASPLICRAMTPNGVERCTRTCSTSSECMTGTLCEPIGSEHYCAASDTGRSCTAAAQCNFACLTSQQYCTNTCATGADCPNGYGCEAVGSPPVRVCVKAEAPCGPGDTSACIASAACDVGPNMVVGGCTLACNTASDCPQRAAGLAPWTCNGLCRRPGDVSGPLETGYTPAQYACSGGGTEVNVCNDGLHIDFDQFIIPSPPTVSCGASMTTTDGVSGDACVDSCRYQGFCPFGNACVAVGSVGSQRAGLCLPTGAGEVGASCSHDRDCVFGYCLTIGVCSRDCTFDGVCPSGTTCTAGGGPAVEGKPFRRCE